MRIDAHQHFWEFNPQRDAWITDDMAVLRRDFLPADLQPLLKTNSFDGCVAVQADQSEEETRFFWIMQPVTSLSAVLSAGLICAHKIWRPGWKNGRMRES